MTHERKGESQWLRESKSPTRWGRREEQWVMGSRGHSDQGCSHPASGKAVMRIALQRRRP